MGSKGKGSGQMSPKKSHKAKDVVTDEEWGDGSKSRITF